MIIIISLFFLVIDLPFIVNKYFRFLFFIIMFCLIKAIKREKHFKKIYIYLLVKYKNI